MKRIFARLNKAIAALGLAALSLGALTASPASAQTIAVSNDFAIVDPLESVMKQDEFGIAIPLDYGLVVPYSNGSYETTSHTRSGYACTITSRTAFAKQPQGNYLFVMDPNGNYLFTNSGGGVLMTPGDYGMTLNGNVQTPKGDMVPVGDGYTTPAGYTYRLNKDGSRSLTLPDGSVFVIQDSVGPRMNPSGLYYD